MFTVHFLFAIEMRSQKRYPSINTFMIFRFSSFFLTLLRMIFFFKHHDQHTHSATSFLTLNFNVSLSLLNYLLCQKSIMHVLLHDAKDRQRIRVIRARKTGFFSLNTVVWRIYDGLGNLCILCVCVCPFFFWWWWSCCAIYLVYCTHCTHTKQKNLCGYFEHIVVYNSNHASIHLFPLLLCVCAFFPIRMDPHLVHTLQINQKAICSPQHFRLP